METLEERGRAIGEAGVARAVARVAEAAAAVPGVRAEAVPEGVVLSGRGLWRNSALRWIGGWLR
jgi:hypothetical protein